MHGRCAESLKARGTNARAFGKIKIFDGLVIQRVPPFGGCIQESDDREQCRLAASRWTRHGDVLSFVNRKVNARKSMGFDLVASSTPVNDCTTPINRLHSLIMPFPSVLLRQAFESRCLDARFFHQLAFGRSQ